MSCACHTGVTKMSAKKLSRREALKNSIEVACGLAVVSAFAPFAARRAYGQEVFGNVVGERPFGRIEQIADGVWALISTPFDSAGKFAHPTTLSNGVFIVGKDRILAVDSYSSPEGGRWVAEACKFLTGRFPTHVVSTHFHFDHLGGTLGFFQEGAQPEVILTQTTRQEFFRVYGGTKDNPDSDLFDRTSILNPIARFTDATQVITDENTAIKLDLGGRSVTITPTKGHTASDLIVTDDQTGVTVGGDLIWDGIFPFMGFAHPAQLKEAVLYALQKDDQAIIVPGHGGVHKAGHQTFTNYIGLLDAVEDHARSSHKAGKSIEEAAAELRLPDSIGPVKYFRDGFHEISMEAWYKIL